MIVEMIHNEDTVTSGYISAQDASAIGEAYASGETVLMHFNAGTIITDPEFYISLMGYEPAYESYGPHYLFAHVLEGYNITDPNGGASFLMSKLLPAVVNSNGKLFVQIYSD